jgi:hypothetical protein
MGKRGRVGEIIRVSIKSLKHQMEKEMSINFFGEREREKMAINLLGLNECIFGNNDSKRKFMELY